MSGHCSTRCFLKTTIALRIHLWCSTRSGMMTIFISQAIINRDTEPPPTQRKSSGDEALHLFIDTMRTRSPGMYTPSEHHFVFTIHNPRRPQPRVHPSQIHHHLDAIPKNIDFHEDIEVRAAKTETGYILEARIPKDLALNAFQPAIDRSIGFNYIMTNLKLMKGSIWVVCLCFGRAHRPTKPLE